MRFTRTVDAFYMLMLERATSGVVEVGATVPWMEGEVRVVGGSMDSRVVTSGEFGEGVRLRVPRKVWNADEFCWVFKITY